MVDGDDGGKLCASHIAVRPPTQQIPFTICLVVEDTTILKSKHQGLAIDSEVVFVGGSPGWFVYPNIGLTSFAVDMPSGTGLGLVSKAASIALTQADNNNPLMVRIPRVD